MRIGCRPWQNLDSTAVAEFVGAPLERRATAETVSLRAIIYRNFSELWETEGVVKRSLSNIIKGTDRPIPPSTEDWKYSKICTRGKVGTRSKLDKALLSPSQPADQIQHSLHVGWRNFFSSCGFVSVFGSGGN